MEVEQRGIARHRCCILGTIFGGSDDRRTARAKCALQRKAAAEKFDIFDLRPEQVVTRKSVRAYRRADHGPWAPAGRDRSRYKQVGCVSRDGTVQGAFQNADADSLFLVEMKEEP